MNEKMPLRCSVPPYSVAMVVGKLPLFVPEANFWLVMSKFHAPKEEEVREMLKALRRHLRWSQTTLGALFGVSPDTLRRWESGQRHPNGAARRLIWLVATLIGDPKRVATAFDLMIWGQRPEIVEFMRQTGMAGNPSDESPTRDEGP